MTGTANFQSMQHARAERPQASKSSPISRPEIAHARPFCQIGRFIVWAAALTVALAGSVLAQDEPVKLDPVKWSFKADSLPRPLKAGEKFDVQITAEIEEGWHLYSTEEMPQGPKPTRIGLAADQPFELIGSIDSPLPQTALDENFGIQTEFYEQSATFGLPLQVIANSPAGKRKLTVQVRYQTYTDKLCLPPKL